YYVDDCFSISSAAEGLIVKGPDGTTYTFGHVKSYYTGAAPPNSRSPLTTFTRLIMVTQIEDRFGNTVDYNYNAQGDLSSIVGSDGRRIDIFYKTYSFKGEVNYIVDYVTANEKTWTYTYLDWRPDGASSETRKYLHRVELPDGSSWEYDNALKKIGFAAIKSIQAANFHPETGENLPGYCQPAPSTGSQSASAPFSTTVTSPDGVRTEYSFQAIYHGRSKVAAQSILYPGNPGGNLGTTMVRRARNLNCSISHSLTNKTISGQGLSLQQWSYVYSQNTGTYTSTDTAPSVDLNNYQTGPFDLSFLNGKPANIIDAKDYRSVTVTGPDSKVVYYIDRRFQSSTEGSIVAEDHLNKSTNALLKRIETNETK